MTLDEKVLEVKALCLELEETLSAMAGKEYTDSGDARRDRACLRQLSHRWHAARQLLTNDSYRQDGNGITYTQGIKRIDHAIRRVNRVLGLAEEELRKEKKKQICRMITEAYPPLAPLAEMIADSVLFSDRVFYLAEAKETVWRSRVNERMQTVAHDLETILSMPPAYSAALVLFYLESGNLSATMNHAEKMSDLCSLLPQGFSQNDSMDRRRGSRTLSVCGEAAQIERLSSCIQMLGLEMEILQEQMPGSPKRLSEPPADFVSIDLETTGSWGVKNGDAPAQIIEIGAVKVKNGAIVDRFDLLINPGRRITEPVIKITHITDEMVAGQPDAVEGITRLLDFAEDLPWVGHDFLANDMPLILRAASPAGITVEPQCFDTFSFASAHKKDWELSGLSLKALAEHFQIEHGQLHRAVEDAEVTAKVVLRIREGSR